MTGPSVTVSPEPIGTGAPCVAVVVGATDGATVFKAVGPGVGVGGAPTAGIVFAGVGLTAGFAVVAAPPELAEAEAVCEATAAEAKALAAAESAGADVATPGDETGALGNPLGNALDAAAAAGPDDAALLL